MTNEERKEARTRLILDQLAKGKVQTCKRCGGPRDRHEITPLGAVICLELPRNAGLTPWHLHGFTFKNGKPYLSLLEQVGALAGLLEERGLPEGYDAAAAKITTIQIGLQRLMLDPDWESEPPRHITVPRGAPPPVSSWEPRPEYEGDQ
jgi:hypothetical protein